MWARSVPLQVKLIRITHSDLWPLGAQREGCRRIRAFVHQLTWSSQHVIHIFIQQADYWGEKQNNPIKKQLSQTSEDWWSFSRMLITLTKQFTWKTSFSADLRTRGCRAFHPRRLSRFETWLCYLCLVFCETDVDAQTSRTISQTTQRHSDGWRESDGESEPLETNWRESRNRTSRSEGVTSTASVTIVIIQPVKVLHSHVIKLFNRFMTAATMFRRGLENCIYLFFLSRCGFFLLNATELSDCCYRLAALTDVWEEFRLKDMSRNRCVIILR